MKSAPKKDSYAQETVLVSSDYERFVPHGQQRIIRPGHVKKLMVSMKQYGFLPSSPIAAIREDKVFRIVDGHHRHAAASTLKIPMYFVLLPARMEQAVGDTNIGKPWTSVEWARKWALEGRPHFLTLNKYVVAGIPLGVAAALLYGYSGGADVGRLLISGEFAVKTTALCDTIVSLKKDLEPICPAVASRQFMEAVALCTFVKEFDVDQLRDKIETRPKSLIKTANRQQMLEQVESIYNYHSAHKIPLAFMAKEAASNRAAVKLKVVPKKEAVA